MTGKEADARSWAATSVMGLGSVVGEIALALSSDSHAVLKGRLANARKQLRDADDYLTRALMNLESGGN